MCFMIYMSLNRNNSDVLRGVQMMENEEDNDEYKVSALRHLRMKRVRLDVSKKDLLIKDLLIKVGGWTCRKRT